MEEGKKYPKGVVCVFYFTRKMGFNLQEAHMFMRVIKLLNIHRFFAFSFLLIFFRIAVGDTAYLHHCYSVQLGSPKNSRRI